jgi:cysteine desulfurase
MKPVYFDYAAATPIDPRVIRRVTELSEQLTGNPSSLHQFGALAAQVLEESRVTIANFLNTKPSEVYFTSSGTESNNLAILGLARANRQKGQHIITSATEHPSVLNACRSLEREGFEVTYLPVDRNGHVVTADFKKALRPQTILATIHLANSEAGVIQDIATLAQLARQAGVFFHTDACQASAFLSLDVAKLGVDALSFNGSKLYAPRGVAALFVQDGVTIFPIVFGGGQEQSLRSGTENVPAIAGLALACEIAQECRQSDGARLKKLRDELQAKLWKIGCQVNVSASLRLPNHLSVVIPSVETNIVAALDRAGLAVSSGSACSSKTQTDSHVLTALGLSGEAINRTVRITLGRPTTAADCQRLVDAIATL